MPRIASIYRYPIKGLSPEPLARATLTPGESVPGDRLYAIENGPSGFNPARPYLPKTRFLMLMKNERLASLRTTFDQDTHELTITAPSFPSPREAAGRVAATPDLIGGTGGVGGAEAKCPPPLTPPHRSQVLVGGGEHICASLRTAEGCAAIESFFAQFCADELRGPPKILSAPGHSFSDVARKVVSVINLASVAAIEDMVGAPVNPLRFRGNLYVDGWPAWRELDLVGKELIVSPPSLHDSSFPPPLRGRAKEGGANPGSEVRLKAVKRIVRCPATNVDPASGLRDLDVPEALNRHLGHADCGVYAEVIVGGEIARGDEIEIG